MARPRRVVVAGAGIGGMTAALALSQAGFPVTLLEAAAQIEEIGAGVQLSPNASGVLLGLGLGPALMPYVVAPEALRVGNARSGRQIVTSILGLPAAVRYGAPFWVIHRGDLQRVLLEALRSRGDVDLHLGVKVEDFAQRDDRVVVVGRGRNVTVQFEGVALVGADGIWSTIRGRLGDRNAPRFCGQTAWRALVPADAVTAEVREPMTTLWLGSQAHLVHYPLRSGMAVNIVVLVRENWDKPVWSEPGDASFLRAKVTRWSALPRDLIAVPERWSKWALHTRPPLPQWGVGPVTLLGDAAHPMLPFLAQGAAMAIEDAAVLTRCLSAWPDDIPAALRSYEQQRLERTTCVQQEAARNGRRYGWRRPLAFVRDIGLKRMGGERLLSRYDWIYDWKDGQG